MDTFVDKLVDKINAQGAVRTQHMRMDESRSGMSERKHAEMLQHLADMEDKLAKNFTQNVTESVKESNACYVEMVTAYKQENEKSRADAVSTLTEQIHSENVKCYRNTRTAMEEIVGQATENVTTGVTESISELLTGLKLGKGSAGVKGLLITVVVLMSLNLVGIIAILLELFHVLPF